MKKLYNPVLTALTSEYQKNYRNECLFLLYLLSTFASWDYRTLYSARHEEACPYTHIHAHSEACCGSIRAKRSTGCSTKQPAATGLCWESHSIVPLPPLDRISYLFALFSGSLQADMFLPTLICQVRHFRFRSHHAAVVLFNAVDK